MHPFLTSEIPGCGGTIKENPEDFFVEEIPSYLPCGTGEHCYLTFEKQGVTTLEAIRRIAAGLKVNERDIGYAGMKDSTGVTRQTISIQKVSAEEVLALELESIRILSALRHTNKLKLGHLKGNRFRIIIRGIDATEANQTIPAILDILVERGIPNYFGYQRYGAQGNSHLIGMSMLKRDWKGSVEQLIGKPDAVRDEAWTAAINAYLQGNPDEALRMFPRHCRSERDVMQRLVSAPDQYEKAFSVIHPRLKKLYLSAVQSFLFDTVVARRIGGLGQLMDGDLAFKHINGACFLVEDPAMEQPRATAFEISASGPMFGCKMKRSEREAGELEDQILADSGIMLSDFDMPGGLRMEGERRPLRVPLGEPGWSINEDALTLEFSLPKGSYATSLVREITKMF